jgi:aldehyde:ferredoxin oxidoreductase
MTTYGYAGKILWVDLSSKSITAVPTMDYADRFLGGRGIAAKVYWDEVSPEIDAFDPENRLIFATGPFCGMPAIGGSRWTICGKTPENSPNSFSYGNLGGIWGAALKFTGYDAIVVYGRSDTPVYLYIHDDTAEFKDASPYWGTGAIETREELKKEHGHKARVVAIGPAGENRAVMAILTADNDAVCTAGLGAVMGSKNFKAVVVKSAKKKIPVAHPERLKELTQYYRDLGRSFIEYLARWSPHVINDFRLIPNQEIKKEPCFGCLGRCCRKTYQAEDGKKGKFMCQSAFFYQPHAEKYYGQWNDVPFYATKLCDTYGLDSEAVDYMISWLVLCWKEGIISNENTGLPFSKLGSLEFIETFVKKISLREGLGDVLANGIEAAAKKLGPEAEALVEKAGYLDEPGNRFYGPRLYIPNAFMYAMEPRLPIQQVHEIGLLIPLWLGCSIFGVGHVSAEVYMGIAKRFWGSEAAGDLTTYEGKALAAKIIQERQYAKESLILCDYLWPLTDYPNADDHVGDPTLESKLLAAVTGRDIDEKGLYRIGERIFNLQRAILVREGHKGREHDTLSDHYFETPLKYDISNPDCVVPGKNGEMTSRKGAVLDREKFEVIKDEYYRLRNWDVATGLQTVELLKDLDLEEVASDLEKRGLVAAT